MGPRERDGSGKNSLKTTSPIDGKSLKMTSIDGARQIRPFRLVFALLHNSKTPRTSCQTNQARERQREREKKREGVTRPASSSLGTGIGIGFGSESESGTRSGATGDIIVRHANLTSCQRPHSIRVHPPEQPPQ